MAGQHQDAASAPRWSEPRPPPKPSTLFIADDRGHLLPHVPRSQVSPWGTFLGTWELPRRLPPAWLDLSAREPRAARSVLGREGTALRRACNGVRTRVTGKLQDPWDDTEPSGKDQGGPSHPPDTPKPEDTPGGCPCPQNPPSP